MASVVASLFGVDCKESYVRAQKIHHSSNRRALELFREEIRARYFAGSFQTHGDDDDDEDLGNPELASVRGADFHSFVPLELSDFVQDFPAKESRSGLEELRSRFNGFS